MVAITTQTRNKDRVMSTALEEIKKRECWGWPHLTAYRDWHGYTIWCWTRSYAGEKIAAEVAYDRLYSVVNNMYNRMSGKYARMNDNQLAATISLWFNCHSCLPWVKQGMSGNTWKSWSYGKVYQNGMVVRVYLEWLHRRRVSERDLFIK